MENEFSKHEKDYVKIYQAKGYTANFHYQDDKLINSETKIEYSLKDTYVSFIYN